MEISESAWAKAREHVEAMPERALERLNPPVQKPKGETE